VDNVFIRKALWKTGSQLALSRKVGQQMLANGHEWMILYGYPSDEMNAYSMRQPGSEILDGFFDRNGRPVGLRHLPTYLAAANPETGQ
jgi:hypothetical protein